MAALGYYTRLGIAPDELSVSYATVLPRAVAGLLLPIGLWAPIFAAFGAFTHWRLIRANARAKAWGRPLIGDETQMAFA